MDYKKLFEFIITEIKKLKGLTMLFIFISSIACLLLDWFIIRHYVTHTAVLDIYRSVYFICGFFSSIFLVNKIAIKIENQQNRKNEQKQRQQDIYIALNELKPLLNRFDDEELAFLKRFVQENSTEIYANNKYLTVFQRISVKSAHKGCLITALGGVNEHCFQIKPFLLEVLKEYFK